MAAESGFIVVSQYKPERHPDTKEPYHKRIILNAAHVVAVEQVFLADSDGDLKMRDATFVKMFGQSHVRVKETIDEVIESLEAAGHQVEVISG